MQVNYHQETSDTKPVNIDGSHRFWDWGKGPKNCYSETPDGGFNCYKTKKHQKHLRKYDKLWVVLTCVRNQWLHIFF